MLLGDCATRLDLSLIGNIGFLSNIISQLLSISVYSRNTVTVLTYGLVLKKKLLTLGNTSFSGHVQFITHASITIKTLLKNITFSIYIILSLFI